MQGLLIPVKQLHLSKQRMARRYAASSRRLLGLTMLADVLEQTAGCAARFVVTADTEAGRLAIESGCEVLPDEAGELNQTLDEATRRCFEGGISELLILPSDVPLVNASDIETIFGCSEEVVVAPSVDGGTNALLRRPPAVIPAAFGPGSATRHLHSAAAAGLASRALELDSIRLDVDTPEDLGEIATSMLDRHTIALARRMIAEVSPGSEAVALG